MAQPEEACYRSASISRAHHKLIELPLIVVSHFLSLTELIRGVASVDRFLDNFRSFAEQNVAALSLKLTLKLQEE